jgi:hypothetical protein
MTGTATWGRDRAWLIKLDTQNNDTQHNGSVVMLTVIYFWCLLCWLSETNPLCWVSLCSMSLCRGCQDTQNNNIQHNNKWIATPCLMTHSIMALDAECYYADCHLYWLAFMLDVSSELCVLCVFNSLNWVSLGSMPLSQVSRRSKTISYCFSLFFIVGMSLKSVVLFHLSEHQVPVDEMKADALIASFPSWINPIRLLSTIYSCKFNIGGFFGENIVWKDCVCSL